MKNKRGEVVRCRANMPRLGPAEASWDETSRDYASHATVCWTTPVLLSSQNCLSFRSRARLRDPTKGEDENEGLWAEGGRRGVRAQQVKCLVVAPNVSDSEELQRQITGDFRWCRAADTRRVRARKRN